MLLASDGNLYLRSGTTNRVHVGLYGVVLNDTLGTMRGYIGDKTSLGIGTLAGYGFLFGGTASGQSHIEYGSTTGNLRLCNSGTNCVFELQGSTGNITSTGSILLATGGSVTSTGNWSLTATAGLSFSASASSGGDTSRSVQWSNGFKMFAYSNGLWIDCASCGADGLTVNDPTQITGLLTVGSTASGAGAKIRPAAISLSDAELGESGREWDRIWSTLPTTTSAAYPIVQMSNQLQQKTNGFNGTLEYTYGIYVCSITVQYGILVGTPSCI